MEKIYDSGHHMVVIEACRRAPGRQGFLGQGISELTWRELELAKWMEVIPGRWAKLWGSESKDSVCVCVCVYVCVCVLTEALKVTLDVF